MQAQLHDFATHRGFFFKINTYIYIKLASRLIKNLIVPLGTLVRKIVRKKLAAYLNVWLHRLAVYR
jgi:hypothetical protein